MAEDYAAIQAGRKERQRKQLATVGRWTLRIGAGAIAAFFGGMMIAGLTRETPESLKQEAREVGFAEVQKRLEDVLVAPSTTVFQEDSITVTSEIAANGQQVWTVSGTLDSQNERGVPLRAKWDTAVIRDGHDLQCLRIRLNEEDVWIYPEWERIVKQNP